MWSDRQLTFTDYWLIVWRHRWLLLLPFVTICIGTLLYARTLPDIYRAEHLSPRGSTKSARVIRAIYCRYSGPRAPTHHYSANQEPYAAGTGCQGTPLD